jgi:hypothetical protein
MRPVLAAIAFCALAFSQSTSASVPELKSIHKVFIDKMPNDLDLYLRAEFSKQFKGNVTVVLKKEDADGIITWDRRPAEGNRSHDNREIPGVARHGHWNDFTSR